MHAYFVGQSSLDRPDMKTLVNLTPLFSDVPRLAAPVRRKLVGEWQCGLNTLSGYAQRKLRLSFAPLSVVPGPNLTTNYSK